MSTDVKVWQETEFLPWKQAMAKYMDERSQQMAKFRENIGALQTIVALLIEGRTKQAMLAWNTLQLHPKLKDLRVSGDGESLTLVGTDGQLTLLKLDDVIAELQQLVRS
jgi:hypothetical protein